MADSDQAKIVTYVLIRPSYVLNENSECDFDNRRKCGLWLLCTRCDCFYSFLGGLALTMCFIIALVTPFIVSYFTFVIQISSSTMITESNTTMMSGSTGLTTTTGTATTQNTVTTVTNVTSLVTATTITGTSTGVMTSTQTTPACNSAGYGTLLTLKGPDPSSYTLYQFNYTATSATPIILFGYQTTNNREYYLDTVSVVDTTQPSIQLLANPDFENSTAGPIGWTLWCSSTCSGYIGSIISGGSYCLAANCFKSKCLATSGIEFLSQSFSAVPGNIYMVSFWLDLGGSGATAANRFFFDII